MPQVVELAEWESDLAPTRERFSQWLGHLQDPGQTKGHVLTYAYRKDRLGGAPIDLAISVRQGSEDGHVIAQWEHPDIGDAREWKRTLTAEQVNRITDYGALWLVVEAHQR